MRNSPAGPNGEASTITPTQLSCNELATILPPRALKTRTANRLPEARLEVTRMPVCPSTRVHGISTSRTGVAVARSAT
jgi:hypothetical protein